MTEANLLLPTTLAALVGTVKPPRQLTVTQWADEYRYLSSEASAEPGKYRSTRAPYQIGIMDAFSDKRVEKVVLKLSSQVGKTEILNNVLAYYMDEDPGPILFIWPSLEVAEAWSKDRLDSMIRDTPRLAQKFSNKSRDAGNTIRHKKFHGGHITIAGSNSPASLSSRPCRVILCDEVNRYPTSAGDEGDPINLAVKRATTFWNRKIGIASTPTGKDGKITVEYDNSDQRKYYVPCPQCGEMQVLQWKNLKFKDNPDNPYMVCEPNGCVIEHHDKPFMLSNGEWRAEKPFNGTAGFFLNELYSPWSSWQKMVKDFRDASKLPDTLKTFLNTALAEEWDDEYIHGKAELSREGLAARCEAYPRDGDEILLPEGVLLMTAAVDVQDDRLEVELLGWGLDEENWSYDYRVLHGDPGNREIWDRLDDILEGTYPHELGPKLKIACACIDSGGHYTEEVYRYCQRKAREKRMFYPVKGSSTADTPLLGKWTRNNTYRVKMMMVGTHSAKETIYARLKNDKPGPGYSHFPAHYDDEYFDQLTAEKKVPKIHKGVKTFTYEKPKSRRNEALDIRVYNHVALKILKPLWPKVEARFAARVEKLKEKPAPEKTPPSSPRTSRELLKRRSMKKQGGFVSQFNS